VMMVMSVTFLISLMALCTMPSGSSAEVPLGSFLLGTPKRSTAGIPSASTHRASSPSSETGRESTPGMEPISLGAVKFSFTNSG